MIPFNPKSQFFLLRNELQFALLSSIFTHLTEIIVTVRKKNVYTKELPNLPKFNYICPHFVT